MSIWNALVGGFVATLVLTATLGGASELRLTRMDLPFLLGTAITEDRMRAKVVGYGLHFVAGLGFALLYDVGFVVLGHAGWIPGLAFGGVHALFVGTVLVNVLLPAVHPRMGSPFTAADASPLLEAPGFMMLNYGRATPVVTVVAHLAYGAIIGIFVGSG